MLKHCFNPLPKNYGNYFSKKNGKRFMHLDTNIDLGYTSALFCGAGELPLPHNLIGLKMQNTRLFLGNAGNNG